jgi:putative membrane protein
MMGWYDGAGWGSWLVMVLVMVAFWALVVAAIVAVLRWTGTPQDSRREHAPAGPSDRAREVLDERFARGDIDEAEYTSRRAALQARA